MEGLLRVRATAPDRRLAARGVPALRRDDREGEGVTVFIPGQLRNYANGRVHWRTEATYRKRWRTGVALVARARAWAAAASPEAPKHVHLEAWTFNAFDDDGLRNACKPVVDGLVDAGVLHSDGRDCGHRLTYGQAIHRGERGVWITIAPHTPAPAAGTEG